MIIVNTNDYSIFTSPLRPFLVAQQLPRLGDSERKFAYTKNNKPGFKLHQHRRSDNTMANLAEIWDEKYWVIMTLRAGGSLWG